MFNLKTHLSERLQRLASSERRPPVVEGMPLLNNTLQFAAKPRDFLVDCAQKYGPMFTLRSATERLVVVTGPLGFELAANAEAMGFHRRHIFDAFSTEAGVDIFGVQGEQQAALRSLLKLGYSRAITAQFVPQMAAFAEDCLGEWEREKELDIFAQAYRLSLYSMMKVVTPIDLRHLSEDFFLFGDAVMYVVTKARPSLWLKDPRYQRSRERVYGAIDEAIERHRAGEFREHPQMYMLDALLQAQLPTGEGLDHRGVRGGALYALCGTFIYVGRLIAFLLYELLRDRSLLEQIQAELHAAFWRRQIDPQLFRRLPHLRGAYLEVLRLYPLLPGLPFRAERDGQLGGYHIDKGQTVLVTGVPGHFSQQHYSRPFQFDAQRCMAPRSEHAKKGAFCPFGAGKRTCLATGLTEVITLTNVAQILRFAELELVQPSFQMELSASPLLASRHKCKARLVGRRTPEETQDPSSLKLELSEASDLRSPFVQLPDLLGESLPAIQTRHYRAGESVLEQREIPQHFGILLSGQLESFREAPNGACEGGPRLGPGRSFGSILKPVEATWGLRAQTDAMVMQLEPLSLMHLLAQSDLLGEELGAILQKRYMKAAIAAAIPELSDAHCDFQLRTFRSGEWIYRRGSLADAFFILASGKVRLGEEELGAGDYFGEMGILKQKPRYLDAQATADAALLCLERGAFIDLLQHHAQAREDVALTVCRRLLQARGKSP